MRNLILLFLALILPTKATLAAEDSYLWLEDRVSPQSLAWVKTQNESTLNTLKADPHFAGLERQIREVVFAKDRLPSILVRGDEVYNFWQDDVHVRGIWRRASVDSFRSPDVAWETVLDLDALAAQEQEDWVWANAPECLAPLYERCLVQLSRGGKDATVLREFDVTTKTWVSGGFTLPEAKSNATWIDQDHLYVGTDFGPGTMSTSGYPIVAKLWERGTPLAQAKEVFRGQVTDVAADVTALATPEGTYRFATRSLTFYSNQVSYVTAEGNLLPVPFPKSAEFKGVFSGRLLYLLRDELKVGARSFARGSLVALPLEALGMPDALRRTEIIFAPTATAFLGSVSIARDALLLDVLDNVKSRLYTARQSETAWVRTPIQLPGLTGSANVTSADHFGNRFVVTYTDFLTPSSLLLGNALIPREGLTIAKQAPARFDASPFETEQWFATSKDGTKVPYFIVHKKDMALDGKNPVVQYGYGGFELSMTPSYLGSHGKTWLERGGVYVLTNIRGGGEFGPAWHSAALGVHRQLAYDDFIAISEDLIARKVTSPAKLAIQGGSNGGLLMGATFVQRPDLYAAVLCEVPLLDMIRYTQIGAGASWIGEYGDPVDPLFHAAILGYSPYQNLRPGASYPEVFFLTNTSDDRVTPAHARKMHALMQAYGYPSFFYENTDGGHAGNANLEQTVLWSTLEYTYLWRKLGDR